MRRKSSAKSAVGQFLKASAKVLTTMKEFSLSAAVVCPHCFAILLGLQDRFAITMPH